mmetsp:Transcript_30979/g.72270  ORF Transcript_30979/g.72270 Transcript_30979/m.72270 type:complete len:275 (-) Transcript_30979:174-998(-)
MHAPFFAAAVKADTTPRKSVGGSTGTPSEPHSDERPGLPPVESPPPPPPLAVPRSVPVPTPAAATAPAPFAVPAAVPAPAPVCVPAPSPPSAPTSPVREMRSLSGSPVRPPVPRLGFAERTPPSSPMRPIEFRQKEAMSPNAALLVPAAELPEPRQRIGQATPELATLDLSSVGTSLLPPDKTTPRTVTRRTAPPPRLQKSPRRRKKQRSFLERCLSDAQRPEVILYTIWWLIVLVLVVYLAEMGSHLRTVWRPLVLLGSIPVMFGAAICFVSM